MYLSIIHFSTPAECTIARVKSTNSGWLWCANVGSLTLTVVSTLVEDLIMEKLCMWAGCILKISVLSFQFCCELKIAQKKSLKKFSGPAPVPQLVGTSSCHQKIVRSITIWGTYLSCRFNLQVRCVQEATNWCFSHPCFPLYLSLFLLLSLK